MLQRPHRAGWGATHLGRKAGRHHKVIRLHHVNYPGVAVSRCRRVLLYRDDRDAEAEARPVRSTHAARRRDQAGYARTTDASPDPRRRVQPLLVQ